MSILLKPLPRTLTLFTQSIRTSTRRPKPITSLQVNHPLKIKTPINTMAPQIQLQGRCVCNALCYTLTLSSPDDARTTLCHCHSCRRAFGGNYGLTAKVPLQAFRYDEQSAAPRKHTQENGVTREFCGGCGAFVCEYGEEAADKFRYVVWGSLDEPEKIPPKGEFFCKSRAEWMPEIPGLFHKKEIKE